MQIIDWIVIAAGFGVIGWVNWYFFAAGKRTSPLPPGSAPASTTERDAPIVIIVDGGYAPSLVRVKAGHPARLVFDRRDTGSCSEEVVFPDFHLRRFLPTGEKTTIEVTPPAPGRYEFMCGMSMLRGALVAEA